MRNVYDLAGQKLQEIRADASPLQQVYAERAYTANGKESWVKDAKGNQTTYSYDGFDRLVITTFPDATHEDLAYDAVGNVTSKLTRGGQLIQNTYDSLDRMVTNLVPQPSPAPAILTTSTYDLAGRTIAISDNTGHSLATAFDSAKRPLSVTQSAPTFAGTRVVAYQLDAAGNKTRATWADGYYVAYAYDALGRMTTATENGTFVLATYIYDTLGRRNNLVYGNGATQGHSYTTQGDLLTVAHALTGTANTYTNSFTKAHQLASEASSNAAWAYVPATFQTTAYAPANNLNQYVNITVGAAPTVTMAYDANGNLTGDGTWTFAYDAQNMLRQATKAGGASSYQYDPLGRRQMLTENGTATTFLHDGDEEIADYAGATVLRRYVPGPGTDMPIAMVTPAGATNTHKYFHTNRQGSTVAMSADNGTMSEGPYTYDAFGNGAPTTGVPFKYTGRRLDAGTGLYYYRARYYSPGLGRFLQTDPIGYGDQMNLYGYVGNDPTNRSDPSGLCDSLPTCRASDTNPRPQPSPEQVASNPGAVAATVLAPIAVVGAIAGVVYGAPAIMASAPQITTATAVAAEVVAPGAGSAALAATAVVATARGVSSEARVLKEMGIHKNNQWVRTSEGRSKPDGMTSTRSVEVKDRAVVSDTRQIRIQTDAAAASGRTSTLVTGTNTKVSPQAAESFDEIIRRDDLGPQ